MLSAARQASDTSSAAPQPPVRLAYLVSHPIQYQAPLLRRLAREPGIDLTVLFGSDFSARGYQDQGFGTEVSWDIPLLEGYRSRVLPALHDPGTVSAMTPFSRGILRTLCKADGSPAFDALWVHGYASVNALRGILSAHMLGIPVLLRAESWLADRPRPGVRLLAKRFFLRALRPAIAAVLPIGSHNADYWHTYFGHQVPQFLMPYAVDNSFFAARARQAVPSLPALRRELALDEDRPVILFASKLQKRKHADHLIEAYRQLLARARIFAAPYPVIVGDGAERARLEQQARDASLAGIRFAGFRNQTELPRFFALADLFVLPSEHEPWGLVVNEAMASSTAVVVSSDVGAAPDLVHNGREGFIFPTGDIPALTFALELALATPQTPRTLGDAAAARIATWDFDADVRALRSALATVTRIQ